jgi:hypothetical protein
MRSRFFQFHLNELKRCLNGTRFKWSGASPNNQSRQCLVRIMEQRVFCIVIDYRGHHRKGAAIYNATWVNLPQKLWFHWTKNVFLNTTESFKQGKLYWLTLFLPRKINICWPFQSCPLYAYVSTTRRCAVPLLMNSKSVGHLQEQLKLPGALWQSWWHPPFSTSHSFTSLQLLWSPLWSKCHKMSSSLSLKVRTSKLECLSLALPNIGPVHFEKQSY